MSDQIGSLGEAEALLQAAVEQDRNAAQPTPVPQEPAAPATPDPQVTPDQPQAPDLFADADIDLTNLSPAEELRIRQMQAHFTRKTQEAAQARKEAEEAMGFVNALQNDPQYALQVHQELSQALQQAGLTPAQADQAAAQQMQTPEAQSQSFSDDDPFAEEDYWQNEEPQYRVPPELQQQIQELQAWRTQQEAEMQRQALMSQVQQQENEIRAENPNYTNDDIEAIYGHAFAFNGDLRQAQQAFEAEKNRILTAYLQQKASVPTGQPTSSGHAEAPPGFGPDLNAAHRAAMEHLARMEAEGLV